MFARSHILPLPEARKIWKAIANPGSKCAFEEKGCKGGAEVETRRIGLTKKELMELRVSENMTVFRLETDDHELILDTQDLSNTDILKQCFLADVNYPIPNYGWHTRVVVLLITRGLSEPLTFSYEVNNTLKVFGRKFDWCHEVGMSFGFSYVQRFGELIAEHGISMEGKEPSLQPAGKVIEGLFQKYEIPNEGDKGFLESLISSTSRCCSFDPTAAAWGWNQFESMIQNIAAESLCPKAVVFSMANSGFLISGSNMSSDIEKLIKHVVDHSPYEKFDATLSETVSMSWSKREKLRKKWKQPILQEVGSLKFNSGGEAEVKIIIEKEGYVFHIELESPEDIMAFEKTPIWKKAEWMPDK